MTIVSHQHRFIFLKTRKTAGSSIELWLSDHLGPDDLVASGEELRTAKPHLNVPARRWPPTSRVVASWLQFEAGRISQHSEARRVRAIVGRSVWNRYVKFAVERNPWDRVISLWQWRTHQKGVAMSLDEFLDAMASGGKIAHHWSNWRVYTINDSVAVDKVLRFETLDEELREMAGRIGLPADMQLPKAKAGIRRVGADILSASQTDRIGAMFRREIELFGYSPPGGRAAAPVR